MLKCSRSFRDCVLNEKDKCLVSLICSCTHKDFRFMYSHLLVLSKFIMQSILYILPFIRRTFLLFNSLQVTNICFVSFVTDDGNNYIFLACLISFHCLFLFLWDLMYRVDQIFVGPWLSLFLLVHSFVVFSLYQFL